MSRYIWNRDGSLSWFIVIGWAIPILGVALVLTISALRH